MYIDRDRMRRITEPHNNLTLGDSLINLTPTPTER